MNKLDISSWKEFIVGELFEIKKPNVIHSRGVQESNAIDDTNSIPYVVRTKFNNGIKCNVIRTAMMKPAISGVVSFGAENASFFYQEKEFVSGRDIYYIDTSHLSKETCLFLITCLNTITHKYSYNNGLFPDLLKKETIKLPVASSGKPDWEYMENYVKALYCRERESISAVAEYVKTVTVKRLNVAKWGTFTIGELFEHIQQGKRLKKQDQIEGDIPFVMAGRTNTGVANYISNPIVMFPRNSITIDIFGNTFYREYEFSAGDDTGVYWNTKKSYSPNAMLFLSVVIQKTIQKNYDFSDKLRSSKSFDIQISLPVTDENTPDWQYMDSYIERMFLVEKLKLSQLV